MRSNQMPNAYTLRDRKALCSRVALRGLFALVLIVAAWTAPPAHAAPLPGDDLVLDLTPGGSTVTFSSGSVGTTTGWSFTVDAPITVDGIGMWRAGLSARTTEAGLWTDTGTLLRSAAFTSSTTLVGSANPAGEWRFQSFAPLTLSVGEYVIGSVLTSSGPNIQFGSPFVTIPQITVTGGVTGPFNTGFAAPLMPQTTGLRIGATLERVPVPEPATLGLLALGLLGAGFVGRKRRY